MEYTLTTAMSKMISTNDALAALSGGLNLTLYPAADLKEFGIAGLGKIEGLVKEAADELNKKFEGKINFAVKNAQGQEAVELAEKIGIQNVNYDDPDTKEKKTTALGLVLELGGSFRNIPLKLQNFFGWRLIGAENLQDNIASSIESLLSKSVEIAYITGHNELSLYGNPYNRNEMTSESFRAVLSDIYSFKEIDLKKDDIPLNIKCAIVNGPKSEFSDKELRKLDQFVMNGGNVLFCLEPLVEEGGGNSQPTYSKPKTGLDKLLGAYGIVPGADYVMDENAYVQRQGMGQSAKMNWAPMIGQKQLDRKNPITKYIPEMIFLQNGSIDISGAKENPDAKTTVLVRSSEKSWTASENIILYPGYIFPPEDKEKIHENNLAVLVEGKFKSAFAGSEPAADEDADASNLEKGVQSDALSAREFLDKSVQSSKIIFISSAQVTTPQLIDENGREPMAYFMRNSVDYLNGEEDYCEMRTKGIAGNLLDIKNEALATIFKLFNQFGLAILVALAGLLVWRLRTIRRAEIRVKYNPNDERVVEKPRASKAADTEKQSEDDGEKK